MGPQRWGCDNLMWSLLDHDGPKGDNCDSKCLYDIVNDPSEKTTQPFQRGARELQQMFENAYSKEPHWTKVINLMLKCQYLRMCASMYMAENGGYWCTWKQDPRL